MKDHGSLGMNLGLADEGYSIWLRRVNIAVVAFVRVVTLAVCGGGVSVQTRLIRNPSTEKVYGSPNQRESCSILSGQARQAKLVSTAIYIEEDALFNPLQQLVNFRIYMAKSLS